MSGRLQSGESSETFERTPFPERMARNSVIGIDERLISASRSSEEPAEPRICLRARPAAKA